MKPILIFIAMLIVHSVHAQKSTIENINDATRNVLDIFKKTSSTADKETKENAPSGSFKLAASESSTQQSRSKSGAVCKTFCVENNNKKAIKADLEYRDTKEKQNLLIMSKDKSCLFDIPLGIYIIRVYIDDKLVKKTDYKVVEEEQETLVIPE